jgi:hypothetical protein
VGHHGEIIEDLLVANVSRRSLLFEGMVPKHKACATGTRQYGDQQQRAVFHLPHSFSVGRPRLYCGLAMQRAPITPNRWVALVVSDFAFFLITGHACLAYGTDCDDFDAVVDVTRGPATAPWPRGPVGGGI